jgi:hypothetical protein
MKARLVQYKDGEDPAHAFRHGSQHGGAAVDGEAKGWRTMTARSVLLSGRGRLDRVRVSVKSDASEGKCRRQVGELRQVGI